MLSALLLLSAAIVSPTNEFLAGQLRQAIWRDLERNAMIGNGNELAALWYSAGQEDAALPKLHIMNLSCGPSGRTRRCSFTLLRDGGIRRVLGETAPDQLNCTARFVRMDGNAGWGVRHRPPHGPGHSRTSMRCRVAPRSPT